MASKEIIQDIDELFLKCPICMEQLKEPKILPCLHRFCHNCLGRTVGEKDRDVECPTCRGVYALPPEGIDGFMTDFNTKNIIEYVQLQQSVKDEKKPGLSKKAPTCHNHPGKHLEGFCTTCGNQPICVSCMFAGHKGHDIQEIATLAAFEKTRLIEKIAELEQYREKIYSRQEEVKCIKRKLIRAVNAKKEELQEEFDLEENKIKKEIRDGNMKLDKRRKELDALLERDISLRKQQLEKEMKDAQQKYDEYCQEERQKANMEFERLQEEIDKDKEELRQTLEEMNKGIKDLLTSLQTQESENSKKINELADHFDGIVNKFENRNSRASKILAANDEWTYGQCTPDLCSEINALVEEARREFPELETLSDITVGGLVSVISCGGKTVSIAERKESVVKIKGVKGSRWFIDGITGSNDGGIAITGRAPNNLSHITVINTKGVKVRQDVVRSTRPLSERYCGFLSPHTIATVCWPDEIGIYDVRDGTYTKTNISDITSSWLVHHNVSCITTDQVNNHIIVGGSYSRDVYVFNSQLEYINKLTLPEMIKCPRYMAVHNSGNLLLCDGVSASVVTMNESPCELIHEFTKPDIHGGEWEPWGVCTSKHGSIFMLWRGSISGKNRNVLVQYSPESYQIVQSRVVDCSDTAYCITTVETEKGEKILIATCSTGKLIKFKTRIC